jgi:hypothetical protein
MPPRCVTQVTVMARNGATDRTHGHLKGRLADVALWSRTLAPHERETLLAGFDYKMRVPFLLGYWDMEEGGGTLVADASQQAAVGLLINSPVWIQEVPSGRGWSQLSLVPSPPHSPPPPAPRFNPSPNTQPQPVPGFSVLMETASRQTRFSPDHCGGGDPDVHRELPVCYDFVRVRMWYWYGVLASPWRHSPSVARPELRSDPRCPRRRCRAGERLRLPLPDFVNSKAFVKIQSKSCGQVVLIPNASCFGIKTG